MSTQTYIGYFRVSTVKQGRSGLGLEAQQQAVRSFLNGNGCLIGEYIEVESGKRSDRPQLLEALKACRLTGSKLVVAKLDRLSRNLEFICQMQRSGVSFVCCDAPHANEMTIQFLGVIAEAERKMISQRTKEAMAAAKARGVKLGNPRLDEVRYSDTTKANAARSLGSQAFAGDVLEVIQHIQAGGVTSLSAMADELNKRGIRTRRGSKWYPMQVSRVIKKAA